MNIQSVLGRKEIFIHATTLMKLENIIWSEIGQSQKDKYLKKVIGSDHGNLGKFFVLRVFSLRQWLGYCLNYSASPKKVFCLFVCFFNSILRKREQMWLPDEIGSLIWLQHAKCIIIKKIWKKNQEALTII
jgi:hypothetical protein